MSGFSQPSSEPPVSKYSLWVDVYDLVNCDDLLGRKVWVQASIGANQTIKKKAKQKDVGRCFTWK